MRGCRKCSTTVGDYSTFCPNCGVHLKLAVGYDPEWKPANRNFVSRLRSKLDAKERRWEKMTPYGSMELEREVSDLIVRSMNLSERSELHAELALAYGIRGLSEAMDMGKYRSASRTCSAAVEADPDNPKCRLQRGRVYRDWESRVRYWGVLYPEDKEDPEKLALLAQEDYNAALAVDPGNTETLMARASLNGQLQASNEDCKAALSILSRAIEADKNDGESLEERAKIYVQLNMNTEALQDYRAAYELASISPLTQHSGRQGSFKLRSIQLEIDLLQGEK